MQWRLALKVTIDLPPRLYHVLQVEAAMGNTTTEKQCVDILKESIEVRLDNDFYYQDWMKQIYQPEPEASDSEKQVQQ